MQRCVLVWITPGQLLPGLASVFFVGFTHIERHSSNSNGNSISLSLSLSKSQQIFFPLSKSHYFCNFFQTPLHLFYMSWLQKIPQGNFVHKTQQNTVIVASLLAPGPQVDRCLLHPLIVCLSACLSVCHSFSFMQAHKRLPRWFWWTHCKIFVSSWPWPTTCFFLVFFERGFGKFGQNKN